MTEYTGDVKCKKGKRKRKDENVRTLVAKKDEREKEIKKKEKRQSRVYLLEIGNIIKFSKVIVTQTEEGK